MKYLLFYVLAGLGLFSHALNLDDYHIELITTLVNGPTYEGTVHSLATSSKMGLIIGENNRHHSCGAIPFKKSSTQGVTIAIGEKVHFTEKNGIATIVKKVKNVQRKNIPWTISFNHHDDGDGGHKTGVIVTLDDQTPYYLKKNNPGVYDKPVARVGLRPEGGGPVSYLWVPRLEIGKKIYYSKTNTTPISAFIFVNQSEHSSAESLQIGYGISNCHFHHDDPPGQNDVQTCCGR